MKSSIEQKEARFLDWLDCKNWVLEWSFYFFGIPVLLLLLIGLFASGIYAVCLISGIL